MEKISKPQRSKFRLPHKTSQLIRKATVEFADRYGNLKTIPSDLLGLDLRAGICWGHACHAATRNLFAETLALRIAEDFNPNDRISFITLIHDGWRTSAENPVIDIREIKRRARDCFRDLGFSGIAILEFDFLLNRKDDPIGHQILPHVHAIGHIDRRRAKKTIAQLKMSKRLVKPWGCATVTRKYLETVEDVMHATAYPLKLPVRTKRRVPNRRKAGSFKMRTNNGRQWHVLSRIVEVLSLLRQKDLFFTIGGRSRWLTDTCELIAKYGAQRERWYSQKELKAIWSTVHADNRFADFGPINLRR